MLNLELSKDLNPNLIYDKVSEKYTLNKLNGILTVKNEYSKTGYYMLNMKYNSIDTPKLRLFVNNTLYDNNFSKTKTGSLIILFLLIIKMDHIILKREKIL